MRTAFLLSLVFIICGPAWQTKPARILTPLADKIIDTIHSGILNEDRFIWIHIPEAAKNKTKEYPIIFLLDAEVNFDATKSILDRLSKEPSSTSADEAILVGIGNIWSRYRDYSPSRVDSSQGVDAATAKTTGGGEAFVSFIEKELLPYIEKKYFVAANRTLIGHSMGGLITINILLKHPHLFDNYIAIDPSMWWDNNKLLNESATLLRNKNFENRRLFLAIANEEEKQMSMTEIKNDTTAKTIFIRPSFQLATVIEKNKQNKLRFEWKFYKDENHMSINTPATDDALKIILK